MRSLMKIGLAATVAAALPALAANEACAADTKVISFHRPTGSMAQSKAGQEFLGPGGATKLKVFIDETALAPPPSSILSGGTLTASLIAQPPHCGTPGSVTVSGDTVVVTWASDCLVRGDCATVRFSTTKGPLGVQRSFYANTLGDSIDPAVPVRVPGAPSLGLSALTALLALAGALVLIRRRGRPISA